MRKDSILRPARSAMAYVTCLFGLVALQGGCNSAETTTAKSPAASEKDTPEENKPQPAAASQTSPQEIVDRMIAAYRKAASYRDEGIVRLNIEHPEGDHKEEYQSSITFQRPNQLRWNRNGVTIVSDGEKVYGKPDGWNGQVIVAEAPKEIQVPALYNIETLTRLSQPAMHGYPVQLDLLVADQPLKDLSEAGITPVKLEPQLWGDRMCDRVGYRTEAGELLLWVDQETSVLRRVDFPTEELRKSLAEQGVQNVTLIADLAGASLDPDIGEAAFAWPEADGEVFVKTLVDPPDSRLAPNPELGKTIEKFPLIGPDGDRFDSDSFAGKITVVDFWATWCGPCRQAMPLFDKTAGKYADNQDVRFLAVSLDVPEVQDKEIAAVLTENGSEVPWARVESENPVGDILGRFSVQGIPLYVIFGKDGRTQMIHLGGDITVEKLSQHIDLLLDGKNAYEEAARLWAAMNKNYEQQIQFARADADSKVFEIPRAEIAEMAQPDSFVVTQLWNNTDLKSPGNVLADETAEETKLLAIDEFRHVVEIGENGETGARYDDVAPKDAVVTFLRTATDKDGNRVYLAGGVAQPRLYLFEAGWKLKMPYPEADTAQIYDAVFSDLDGDGTLEMCIGYMREAGIHCVTLDGRRLWRNRTVANVGDLALTTPDDGGKRRVVCAHFSGDLVAFDDQGREEALIQVPSRALTNVAIADLDGDGSDELCTLAIDAAGARFAMGFTLDGELKWQTEIARGEHESPLEAITKLRLGPNQPAHWLIASADGVIHLISADGKTHDRFATGKKLNGLAAVQFGGQPTIVISSDDGISAWSVETN